MNLFSAVFSTKKQENARCTPVKPETCRAGPITFDINFSTKKVEWFLKKSEICAFAGELYSNKAAFKDHFEVAKKELTQSHQRIRSRRVAGQS